MEARAAGKQHLSSDLCAARAALPERVSELVSVMLTGLREPGTHPDGEEMKAAQSTLDCGLRGKC